jgi:ABC-2 type transport system ATP-binding protein
VHPGRTGRTHLRLLAQTIRVSVGRVDEALGLVGLTDAAGRRIGGCSLGMRQRLGIPGALLADPPVLVVRRAGRR